MKTTSLRRSYGFLFPWRSWRRVHFSHSPEEPIRAELFSIERLEQHAESLAAAQRVAPKGSRARKLLPRVKENSSVLAEGYRLIAQSIREDHFITPAAEWLVDNYHIVEGQIWEIIDDLPPSFYRRLPKLADGHLKGYPRIYGVAWAYIAHTDGRFDPEWLRRFVRAYQRSEALQIGELWALAISLRIILVENLRRMTERIVSSRQARHAADTFANSLLALKNPTPEELTEALLPYEDLALSRAFVVQLLQRLRDQEGRVGHVLTWIDKRLAAQQTTAEEIVHREHRSQTSMNTSMRNAITSMRLLSSMDWAAFFEQVSKVDEILARESNFATFDFPTRDLYRHAIEELSRGSGCSEVDIATRCARKARVAGEVRSQISIDAVEAARRGDPGYYLLMDGRSALEKELRFKTSYRMQLRRLFKLWATPAYLGLIVGLTAFCLAVPLAASQALGASPLTLWLLGFIAFLPASDLAVAITQGIVTDLIAPRILPKLDLQKGIPESLSTLVAMPTLLTNPTAVSDLLERLEIHYLSNSEGALQFALLTDWVDAPLEHQPEDAALLSAARDGIARLNDAYPRDGSPRFFLLHRKRAWNDREGVWMGWERKRGKLRELNRFLRGDSATTFMDPGNLPQNIRYVITLDADTHLGQGAAYKLVSAMAHPLNRPRFSPEAGRVVEGYGVMQPRITPTLPSTGFGSIFQRIHSGPAGIDPYAFAVSDVYQDLFDEGSYTGKGIYDVDAFEASQAGRVPENTMLSHDLFEGLYARTALVTDVEFFEDFPEQYEVAAARSHRWARGDWQLLRWIFSGRLPLVSRWKMFDNLRRSLSAPAAWLTLVLVWGHGGKLAAMWMGFILCTIAVSPLWPVLVALVPRQRQISIINHWRGVRADLLLALEHIFLTLTFLPHQAWLMTDAIGRTLHRLLLSHRLMLEWISAEDSKHLIGAQRNPWYRRMISARVLALLALTVVLMSGAWRDGAWMLSWILLWMMSPWVADWISQPVAVPELERVSAEDRALFRRIGRKTWRFFESFVTETHYWLPPDNFQEIPNPVVARRTSPTNIGLYLLSVVSARAFGWLGVSEAVERLEATLRTVRLLKRHRGHLFNWYDTRDLRALEPLYISTVDSGNLAGHLWAVAGSCRAWVQQPLDRLQMLAGFDDVLSLLAEESAHLPVAEGRRDVSECRRFREMVDYLREWIKSLPTTAEGWEGVLSLLERHATGLVDLSRTLGDERGETLVWSESLLHQVRSHQRDVRAAGAAPAGITPELEQRLESLARTCDQVAQDMEFGFLCDPVKKIFSIGYQMNEQKLDPSFYDLLASEARLASFVAIAKGDLPALHWFHLSRSLNPVAGSAALLSWSGSMFEYLMPPLVMRQPTGSLLDQTCRNIVRRQMEYGGQRQVPWGISESGYNAQDLEFTYQYSNFGVPGLGLKRGLAADLLIAPYATLLAAMVNPAEAAKNLRRLASLGAEGRYGFYEALDYTEMRLPENQKVAIVQAFMAHHQGMTMAALANVLFDGMHRQAFHSNPRVQAAELLLQERTPREVPKARERVQESSEVRSLIPPVIRRFQSAHESTPRTHLLSNGRYSVMITTAGSGYSRWHELAVTRWREDATRDAWGTYFFLRDVKSGTVWTAGYQPSGVLPDHYEVDFSEDRAEFIRHDGDIITTLDVVVSPEHDAEIRRITLKNTGEVDRVIEVTSYAEVVLASPAADLAHPAFSNLFIQTEFAPDVNGLLCTRRPRSPEDTPPWAAHVVVVDGTTIGPLEYESDRSRFLGRGRSIASPRCMVDHQPLSNTSGAVLDPVLSLRRRVRVAPQETVQLIFSTMVSTSRDKVLDLADKYHDLTMFERTVTQAWTQAHIQQHHLGLLPSEAHLYQDMASRIIYAQPGMRAPSEVLRRNIRSAHGLWPFAISGDYPIVLVRIDDADDRQIVRDILRAHEYWRLKNLAVDIVILNEHSASYAAELQSVLESLVRAHQELLRHEAHAFHGDIFVLRSDRLSVEDRVLLLSASRVILLSRHGSLAQQMEHVEETLLAAKVPERGPSIFQMGYEAAVAAESLIERGTRKGGSRLSALASRVSDLLLGAPDRKKRGPASPTDLQFFNGYGGFSPNGRDYVITLGPGQTTPAPWVNVISNPQFGFQVSESGSGYTWSVNSRENQLTPWSNDPVSDPSGEAFYIKDEETGDVWTPTALPIRQANAVYTAAHSFGASRFEHESHEIASELLQFVPLEDSVKISRLRLTNTSNRTRHIAVTGYVEWVMGFSRAASAPFIVTERDEETGAILARNAWNADFAERVSFLDLAGSPTAWTGDRTEFVGRNGSLSNPLALHVKEPLSGSTGPGLDPCAVLQTSIRLEAGKKIEILFLLGQGENRADAVALVKRYRNLDWIDAQHTRVAKHWQDILENVQVHTPDPATDILLNGWLLYQTLACRLWSRASFYQAGGAYGFRDQLQDVMALTVARRDLAREQILRAAAHQFGEGDVQHWWHPPTDRGVRTRISDDLLWLPYVVSHYLDVTQDESILDEAVPFLEGQTLAAGKEDAYFLPATSTQTASLFEHCARALDRSLVVGSHGLPLMGTGDWNDGMNRVGFEGKGESVWLGWFLHTTLWEFAKVAEKRAELARAERWRLHVHDLKAALEREGWDGDWYRRAYFDDGTPLGSASQLECRIDSIVQSWGVLSGAADPARGARAMMAVDEQLVRRQDKLVLLFTPPFDKTNHHPGYIQGYLPGVRENGGQYTHAAAWSVMAFASLGHGDKAMELFKMLNPINHTSSRADVERYKVEPYVLAGDVYSVGPHAGRGGWTWYTGSAGWMYRAAVEWILGFRLRGTTLFMDPCIPKDWPRFDIDFRYHSARYHVRVENPQGVSKGIYSAEMDGKSIRGAAAIYLKDDGAEHQILIVLG